MMQHHGTLNHHDKQSYMHNEAQDHKPPNNLQELRENRSCRFKAAPDLL